MHVLRGRKKRKILIFGFWEDWLSMDEKYSPRQIESVLKDLGIQIVGETDTNFLCYCIYHHNNDSPAMSVSKETGLFLCFSPICDERGNLEKLVKTIQHSDFYTTMRFIGARQVESDGNLEQDLDELFRKDDLLPSFDINIVNELHSNVWDSPGLDYLHGRGLLDETIDYFQLGYSIKNEMITIPVHDIDGNCVGIVGRSIHSKRFKNSKDLPSRRILFNAHRAKKAGERVITVESSMDCMRVHQAGFPGVVATNGGFWTDNHTRVANKYWNDFTLMFDLDDPDDHRHPLCRKCSNTCLGHSPGRALGEKVIKALPGKRIYWSAYDYLEIFPDNKKDAAACSDLEIAQCIKNRVSAAEYEWWKKESPLLARV